jgi:predicted hotdog family 3-hydroxylacyl-ACP dehydratase
MNEMPFAGLALPCPIAEFVPHQRGMCLLDRILTVDDQSLRAEVVPRETDLFATAAGIPGWVGLEWMAQAVAAWAGVQEKSEGGNPLIGFLLGSRRYQCTRQMFVFGEPVLIDTVQDFCADNGLAAFHCQLLDTQQQVLASATLNVFQPDSEQALTAPHNGEKI